MVSIRIDKCSSPLPETLKVSAESVSSTRRLTLVITSLKRRSRRLREVTNLPSFPAKGELLTIKFIARVGSSILTKGNGSMQSVAQAVSPISRSAIPATWIISPTDALSSSTRFKPLYINSFAILTFEVVPSLWQRATVCPTFTVPRITLPTPILPR